MTPAVIDRPARPIVAAPSVDKIPDELRSRPQWILWRYEWNGKRWTKIPYSPTSGRASSTDPGSWARLDIVMGVYQRGGFDGIGFVFTEADPFVGTDLDHCFTVTGELTERARQVVGELATYTERSPSGTGLHLICRGVLPGPGRNNRELGIEMYDRARYFTVTGDHDPGTPGTLEDRAGAVARVYQLITAAPKPDEAPPASRQEAAPQMSDAEVLRRARAAANGPKFAALYDRGDTSAYPSDSEADLALCCILAFWTRDASQLSRIVSMGALGKRDKWQRDDYRRRTIERALAAVSEYYDPRRGQESRAETPAASQPARPGLVRLADVRPEVVRWLWPGRLPLGKLTVLDGDPGLGKSMIGLDLAARLSRGSALPDGSRGDMQGPIGTVILSAEDGLADTIRPRLDAAGADVERIVALTCIEEENGKRLPTLADLVQIATALKSTGAGLVIIDPLMAYVPETVNSYRDPDVRRLLAPLADLADHSGAAVLVIRHLNKSAGGNPIYRGGGSIGIIGAARSGLVVAPDPDEGSDPAHKRRILAVVKCNLAVPPPALAYRVTAADNGAARIEWDGPTEHTAASLLAVPANTEDRAARSDAQEFLREVLADGPRLANELFSEAKQAGIAVPTLKRAKKDLGINSQREGFGRNSKVLWAMPIEDQAPIVDHIQNDDPLCSGDPLRADSGAAPPALEVCVHCGTSLFADGLCPFCDGNRLEAELDGAVTTAA